MTIFEDAFNAYRYLEKEAAIDIKTLKALPKVTLSDLGFSGATRSARFRDARQKLRAVRDANNEYQKIRDYYGTKYGQNLPPEAKDWLDELRYNRDVAVNNWMNTPGASQSRFAEDKYNVVSRLRTKLQEHMSGAVRDADKNRVQPGFLEKLLGAEPMSGRVQGTDLLSAPRLSSGFFPGNKEDYIMAGAQPGSYQHAADVYTASRKLNTVSRLINSPRSMRGTTGGRANINIGNVTGTDGSTYDVDLLTGKVLGKTKSLAGLSEDEAIAARKARTFSAQDDDIFKNGLSLSARDIRDRGRSNSDLWGNSDRLFADLDYAYKHTGTYRKRTDGTFERVNGFSLGDNVQAYMSAQATPDQTKSFLVNPRWFRDDFGVTNSYYDPNARGFVKKKFLNNAFVTDAVPAGEYGYNAHTYDPDTKRMVSAGTKFVSRDRSIFPNPNPNSAANVASRMADIETNGIGPNTTNDGKLSLWRMSPGRTRPDTRVAIEYEPTARGMQDTLKAYFPEQGGSRLMTNGSNVLYKNKTGLSPFDSPNPTDSFKLQYAFNYTPPQAEGAIFSSYPKARLQTIMPSSRQGSLHQGDILQGSPVQITNYTPIFNADQNRALTAQKYGLTPEAYDRMVSVQENVKAGLVRGVQRKLDEVERTQGTGARKDLQARLYAGLKNDSLLDSFIVNQVADVNNNVALGPMIQSGKRPSPMFDPRMFNEAVDPNTTKSNYGKNMINKLEFALGLHPTAKSKQNMDDFISAAASGYTPKAYAGGTGSNNVSALRNKRVEVSKKRRDYTYGSDLQPLPYDLGYTGE